MKEPEAKLMIIKIQKSQFSSEGVNKVLIYDKDREYVYEGLMTPEVDQLMGDDQKAYFRASLIPNEDKNGKPDGTFQFGIGEKVDPQLW